MTYIGHDTQRKNKFEEEFFPFLKSKERMLVPTVDFLDFKKMLFNEYSSLKDKHKRCKPKEKHCWDNDGDLIFHCGYVQFQLLEVKPKLR